MLLLHRLHKIIYKSRRFNVGAKPSRVLRPHKSRQQLGWRLFLLDESAPGIQSRSKNGVLVSDMLDEVSYILS